jgi:acyl-CoA synthetase (NDP forming)/RimJ/RimL family protein N-acetyltransferase
MSSAGAALRTDGRLVTIRPASGADRAALHALDAAASDRSIRFRYFSVSRGLADRYSDTIAAAPQTANRDSFVAEIGQHIVGLAAMEQISPDCAEIAVMIADSVHHEGIGTLLVEALVGAAHNRRLEKLCADVLADNTVMVTVLRALGLPLSHTFEDGVMHVLIDLETDADLSARVTERERRSEVASLRHVLAPAAVAVIGVGSRENSVGRAVLRNIVDAGYTGDLAVVHPRHHEILGLPTVSSPHDLTNPPDLAVVAVPASEVLQVVDELGAVGTKAVLLLTAGFGETGAAGATAQQQLLAVVRRHGMRLVGPNCLGVMNADTEVRLNATFATMPSTPGGFALGSQSGAVGIAVAHAADTRGLGVGQFVSMGNKVDVSGNDLLLAWSEDPTVRVIGLYLESVGNPRKFARIARDVTRRKPVLALKAGRGAVAQRAGQSHTAAAAATDPVVNALFAQTGVQRVDTMSQLLDAACVLDQAPLPLGDRIVIVGNSGGPEILATDAAEACGLQVPELSAAVQRRLRELVPTAASVTNPVDLGAAVQPTEIGLVLATLGDCPEIDSIVTVFTETLTARPDDVRGAVAQACTLVQKPVVAIEVGAAPRALPVPGSVRMIPVFGFPEDAVQALGVAVAAARAMTRESTRLPKPEGLSLSRIRVLVEEALRDGPRWLEPDAAARLLNECGITVASQLVVSGRTAALDAARRLGYPVVLKRAVGVHKSDTDGVVVDVRTESEARKALRRLDTDEVLVQRMYGGGVELIVGAAQDPRFGPVVMVGPGGVFVDLIAEHNLGIAPLDNATLDGMLGTSIMTKLLTGYRNRPAVSRQALADVVTRVAWLVEHFPEVAELDINPLVCAGDELVAVDVKIRLTADITVRDPMSRLLSESDH